MDKHKTRSIVIGAAIGSVAILIAISLGMVGKDRALNNTTPMPPSGVARLDINVSSSGADLVDDEEPFGLRVQNPASSSNDTIVLFLVVTNLGVAEAKNINIDFIYAPHDPNWLDFRSKDFVEGDLKDVSEDPSSDRSNQATLSPGSKIRISYEISISPDHYLESKRSNPSITFFVTYDDHEEEISQYRICFDDCPERLGRISPFGG